MLCCAVALRIWATPSLCESVLRPRFAGLCQCEPVLRHRCVSPGIAVAKLISARPLLCTSVLGRCGALPLPRVSMSCRRPATRRYAFAMLRRPLLCPCSATPCIPCPRDANRCLAIAARTIAVPLRRLASHSRCEAAPVVAQPMRALCCALPPHCGESWCLAAAAQRPALPSLGRALQCPCRASLGIAPATGA